MEYSRLSGANLFTTPTANGCCLLATSPRAGFLEMAFLLEVGRDAFLIHFLFENPDRFVEFCIDNSHVDQTYHLASVE